MKNLIIIFLLIAAGLVACKKEKAPKNVPVSGNETPADTLDSPDNCGCGAIDSIAERTGVLRYSKTISIGDTVLHNKFWITKDIGNLSLHYMICNTILPPKFMKLKEDNDTITTFNVVFSGNLKHICWDFNTIYDNIYYDIVLTKIDAQ